MEANSLTALDSATERVDRGAVLRQQELEKIGNGMRTHEQVWS